jgi:hypothetical protein
VYLFIKHLLFLVVGMKEEDKVLVPRNSVYSVKGPGLILMLVNDVFQVPEDREG